MKFQRNYRLIIQTNAGESLIIEPPTTIEFTVQRSTMGTLNSMQLQIYNISEKTRNQIFQDRYNPKVYKAIVLQAGYKELSTIFAGNIFEARSRREGTEFITFIDARDGGFDTVNNKVSTTLQEGTSIRDAVKNLIGNFTNIRSGKITENIEGEFRRPAVINGNTFQLIRKYSQNKAYIDLETVNILNNNEVVEGDVPLITSETGLLGTPDRADSYLTINTIFEPRIIMGQLLEIQSSTAPVYDGQYKVTGLTHSGIISEAIGGQCTSTFNLLVGSQLFGGFNLVS